MRPYLTRGKNNMSKNYRIAFAELKRCGAWNCLLCRTHGIIYLADSLETIVHHACSVHRVREDRIDGTLPRLYELLPGGMQ